MKNKILATLLTSAMLLATPAFSMTGKAADTLTPDKEGLVKAVTANMFKNRTFTDEDTMNVVHKARNRDVRVNLKIQAKNIYKKDGKTTDYQLYDVNRDGIDELFTLKGSGIYGTVTIYRMDDYSLKVSKVKQFSKVTEIHKNAKKKQIALVTIPGAQKMNITTYKMSEAGKLSKVTIYTKVGKNYKMNGKKITKKTFDAYYKTVKKLGNMKWAGIAKIKNYSKMKLVDETFYSKDLFHYFEDQDYGVENFVMTKANQNTGADQDKFLAFSYAYDKVDNNTLTSDPGLSRIVFGPYVKNPKTGKTYQEEDFTEMCAQSFGNYYACPILQENKDENGNTVTFIDVDGVDGLTATESTFKNGDSVYATMEYRFAYGDAVFVADFYKEGPYEGRIAQGRLMYPEVLGSDPAESWTYSYGHEVTGNPEWDPVIDICVDGSCVKQNLIPGSNLRTLKVEGDFAQTIETGDNVRFELYSGYAGHFYSFDEKGNKVILPIEKGDGDYTNYDNVLNPPTGQFSSGNPAFEKGLFWEANE